MAKQKYYVVWVGNAPGIYDSWAACKAQVDGFTGAKYKSFDSRAEAERAYKDGWKRALTAGQAEGKKAASGSPGTAPPVDYDSISVDVGTSGNPGPIEYKGVDTRTGEVIFSYGPISKGTNNLGEFLAIVHALAYLKKTGSDKTVYSDSRTALKWVKEKKVATNLARDESTREVWTLVDRAVQWLQTNSYKNKLLKWETSEWGEIKADYGRK
ncbi:ribonuclease H [Cohnella sp. CFH 77786]|uniref:ribonuclease H n=1 Tax=Cohnella sp. CFH 77786 TaxID=2662265 RepID=UPI001C60C530|nr:ribonuclease H family protein [Cohnella sp. CFH 77786]MBW5447541.1 ribonuclease H [Cohnella sp. CFH 77786]